MSRNNNTPTSRTLEQYKNELVTLTEVSKALTSPLKIKPLLDSVMQSISKVLDSVDAGTIMLWDPSSNTFRAEGMIGYDPDVMKQLQLAAGESITGHVFDMGEIVLLQTQSEVKKMMFDLKDENRELFAQALNTTSLPRSAVAAPIILNDQKIGVLVLTSMQGPVDFSERDLPFIETLAELIALAIYRERLQQQSEQSRNLDETNRLRSEVMATLSHELRTPLAAIKGYSTALLLEEVEWPEEKRVEFLRLIEDECNHLEGMITDILDSSLIDVGQLVIEPQPIRLPVLIKEITDEMKRHSDIHQIELGFPGDFPILDVDPRRIKQVVRNILDNAIKYSPEGGLIFIAGEVRADDVVVSISDQGVGISPEDLVPLFEKYFRVKSPTGHHVAGTGLGLPVAREIIEAHGGKIWAESEVGEGTTLYFSLPYGDIDQD